MKKATTDFESDVCLLLEGTYPYVRGGVSEWVHQLISALPELRFSLVFLGSDLRSTQQQRYQLPSNVVRLYCYYLASGSEPSPAPVNIREPDYAPLRELHRWFRAPQEPISQRCLRHALLAEGQPDEAVIPAFFHGETAWQEIVDAYMRQCPGASFLKYLWTVRNTHAPLLRLIGIARKLESAGIYHTVSTGYAGLLGAMLRHRTGRPLVLTEHGIYTKERRIELQAMVLREQGRAGGRPEAQEDADQTHQLWVRVFEGIGHLVYQAADTIITLHEKNRQRQIADGAPERRTRVIPNGVDVQRFRALRERRPADPPLVIGLIGRVVPIKDIKTFIRAIGVLAVQMPAIQGWMVGPEEEDPSYATECRELVDDLGLQDHIRFLGFQRVEDILPQLGLLALTSISEAFPLVIGESHASGLPVVATDVGACRDLIEGVGAEDRALGCGGAVVPIVDPEAFADAAQALLSDRARWISAQKAGIERVERLYPQSRVIAEYRLVYRERRTA